MRPTPREIPPRRKILLVDDAEELREAYRSALEDAGYDIETAGAAEEALVSTLRWRPDLVLTDVIMPGMGGFELISRIRSDMPPPVPPIVALSGFPDARSEALRRGAARFELKPLSLDALLDVVEAMISGKEIPGHGGARREGDVVEQRAATRAIGEATAQAVLEREPELLSRLGRGVRGISRYFGHSTAVALLSRGGSLRICASSNPEKYPVGDIASDLLVLANDVLASGATLILPDVRAQALLHRTSPSIRFVVSVPYFIDRTAVGTFSLVDDMPHEFSSADLAFLEYVALRWSARLATPFSRSILDASGLLGHQAFEALVVHATDWALAHDACVGVSLLALSAPPERGSCDELAEHMPGARMLIGLLDRHRVAVFAAAETVALVQHRLRHAREILGARLDARASAELVLEAPVPRVAPALLLDWAGDILAHATSLNGRADLSVAARYTSTSPDARDR